MNARLYPRSIETDVTVVRRFGGGTLLLRGWFDVVISSGGAVGAVGAVGGRRVRHSLFPLDGISNLLIWLRDDLDFDKDGEELGVAGFGDVAPTHAQDAVGADVSCIDLGVVSAVQHGAGKREERSGDVCVCACMCVSFSL